MRFAAMGSICGAMLATLASSAAMGAPPADLPALFGSRVQPAAGFAAPAATGDLDGDGIPDQIYLVTIRPAAAHATFAPGVSVVGTVFGQVPLGSHGEKLALAVVQRNGAVKTILTGRVGAGDDEDVFATPIWSSRPAPISLVKRGSKAFARFQRQDRAIRHDVLAVGTEAGIDMALYWNAGKFALFRPNEEP